MRIESYLRLLGIIAAGCAGYACAGPQSALTPAGVDAERIDHLFTVMTVGALLVWGAVVAIAVYSIRTRATHSERAANLFVLGGGVILPAVVLAALLAYGLPVLPAVLALPTDDSLVIHVTGKQWWWRVQYVTPDGRVETANEIRLPVGRRVQVQLTSPDVIHAFWVPSLAGKIDMIPGRVTRIALEPTRTGVFRGACAEYCGASHALMAFVVVVVAPDEFTAWLDGQRQPATVSSDPTAARGSAAFLSNGCSACHAIRGTPAAGQIAPDLTHVGGRLSLAAGTLPNDRNAFVEWLARTDHIKPGVLMPAFPMLTSDDRLALAAYLDGLQ